MNTKTVAAGAFKQGWLAMLDEVAAEQIEIVITKRGRPVARVVPIASKLDRERMALEKLSGSVKALDVDALMSPSSELVE